jgi:flotillin
MNFQMLLVIAGAAATFVAIAMLLLRYRKVGPNKVLIVSGRRGSYLDRTTGETVVKSFRIYHGGGTFVMPLREKVDMMSVELMTLEIRTPEFFTKFGVPIVVDGIAQIKVRSDDPLAVATAAEMFLSKTEKEMNEIAHQMMQGHLRAVISTMPFEQIHADPESFQQTVQRLTAADLANMGVEVVSFTIREVRDPSGYLQALGRPQLATVQKNAEIGEAQATRDAAIGRSEAERDARIGKATAERAASVTASQATQESEHARIVAALSIAEAQANHDRELHEFAAKVAAAQAASDIAYEKSRVKEAQSVAREQLALDEIVLQRREQELQASVHKPANAERYRLELIAEADAEAQRRRGAAEAEILRMHAEASADAHRMRGLAEADVIRARGEANAEAQKLAAMAEADGLRAKLMAEAEGMHKKAEAWKQYGQAAMVESLISRMPEVAREIAAPLAKIDRIVLLNGGENGSSGVERISRGVTDVMMQVGTTLEALTGVDMRSMLAPPSRSEGDRGAAIAATSDAVKSSGAAQSSTNGAVSTNGAAR